MLSSTLPHCSRELASYYRSTMRRKEFPFNVRYVQGCVQLLYLPFSVILSVFVPEWIRELFGVLTVEWFYMTWQPKASQWGQRDLQAILTYRLSWDAVDFLPAHVHANCSVLSVLDFQVSERYIKCQNFRVKSQNVVGKVCLWICIYVLAKISWLKEWKGKW